MVELCQNAPAAPLVVRPSRLKLLPLAAIFWGGFGLQVGAAVSEEIKVITVVGGVLFLALAVFVTVYAILRPAALVADREGIRKSMSGEVLPWSAITAVRVDVALSPRRRPILVVSTREDPNAVEFSLSLLESSPDEILSGVEARRSSAAMV